jgi:alpha-ketoglutarate-dependent taurine dioxygenase
MGRSVTNTTSYQARQASPRIGAEITGLDLTSKVDDATAEALRKDFITYKVLVFRGQHLTPDQHVEAIKIFDEPFDHPTVAEAGTLDHPRVQRHEDNRLVYAYNLEKAGSAARWHVGGTWRNPPFSIESLTYQVVPEVGGHTLWADLQAAYDDLSEPFKELLESVSAVYDGNAENYGGRSDRLPLAETIEHPVVRTHRYTGRKGLFISHGALRLTGIEPEESEAILPFLLAHASSPNYIVGFGWKPGDFVLWDNLATWHYAVNDYDGPRAYRKVIAAQPAEAS